MFSPKAIEQIKAKLSNLRENEIDDSNNANDIEDGFQCISASSSYENINLEDSSDTKGWRILPPLTKAKKSSPQALQRLASVVSVSDSEEGFSKYQVQN